MPKAEKRYKLLSIKCFLLTVYVKKPRPIGGVLYPG